MLQAVSTPDHVGGNLGGIFALGVELALQFEPRLVDHVFALPIDHVLQDVAQAEQVAPQLSHQVGFAPGVLRQRVRYRFSLAAVVRPPPSRV